MPSNPYYDHGTVPTFRAPGRSSDIRAELDAITTGLDAVDVDITALETGKGDKAGQVWTGVHEFPATTSIGTVSETEISYLEGATSALQAQINLKAPISSPTFTDIPRAPTAAAGTNTTQLATVEFVQTATYYATLAAFTSVSSTSMDISVAVKTFTIEASKSFVPGQSVVIAYTTTPENQMNGTINSYNPATGVIVVNVTSISGSGIGITAWTVAISGLSTSASVGRSQLLFFGGM